MKLAYIVVLLSLAAGSKSAPFKSESLTYPFEGIKEFKIEATGSGLCVNKDAKLSLCEDKNAKIIWKWQGNNLQNTHTGLCLIYKNDNVTVDDCSLKGTKKNKISTQVTCSKTVISIAKKRCLKVTEANALTTVNCDSEKPSSFNIYLGKPLLPRGMICIPKYDIGKRTNDPQYYYFKNDDFKITWVTKYVKLYVVFSVPLMKRLTKMYGDKVDEEVKAIISDGISMLDKAYRQINLRVLLAGYEAWKDNSPLGDTIVYNTLKANFRNYSHYHLRANHEFDGSIYFHNNFNGRWTDNNGKTLNLGGAGMSDLCRVKKDSPKSEMFIMAMMTGYSALRILNVISHEFGHQVFQGHNFEPGKKCPFYRMFGAKCTMGGNDEPKGFSSNFFKALQSKERSNLTACVNTKPNLGKIQSPQMCGNGIVEIGEECDCGDSQDCLTSNPCCDGMICKLKPGAQCGTGKCCSQCKRQITGACAGPTDVLTNRNGIIQSDPKVFNVHRHWKIVAKPGETIMLRFLKKSTVMDFHIDCAYDYIEVRDGGSETSKVLGKYCNNRLMPYFLTSSSNEMLITFHSDMSFASVFKMQYSIVHPDSYRQGSFTLRKAREFRTHTKCTGEGMKLKCDNKTLEIESSHYGYIQSSKCTKNATSSCQTVDVTSIMKTKCEGKKFCKVKVKESDFGNHCQGVQKGLSVKFDCVKQDSAQQAPFKSESLTYPFEGIKEFKIEATGSGLCVNKDAKLSLCEDKNAKTIWKWQGNNLQNTHTGLCLIYKNGNVTVDDCSLKGTKKNKISTRVACLKTAISVAKKRCLKVTEDNALTTVICDKEKPSSFNIYLGKPLLPRGMICIPKYDIGKRTNDPQYYYFKNDDFKITWVTKYVKLYVVFSVPLMKRLTKMYGDKVDEEVKAIISDGISMLDKAYRQINIRVLLAGYEAWKDNSPLGDTIVYKKLKANFRNYSYYHLRANHEFDGSIYFHNHFNGRWTDNNGKTLQLGGAGMSDLCRVKKDKPKSEMFIMAMMTGYSARRILNVISHEFGHQVFQGHNFEPGKKCPFYRMFGAKCTMGGNDEPKGFSSNFFKALQSKERNNLTACVNTKPNLGKIQSPKMCGNGIVEIGEECDCGDSQDCLTSNPCCDGMICKLKPGAQCSTGKCCSQCKRQITGACAGPTDVLTNRTGIIQSDPKAFDVHRHWKIVAKPGETIILRFLKKKTVMDFHIDCAYDYIEVRDGGSETSKVLGKYCNNRLMPYFLISSSNEMLITFHSDMSFASVFKMQYSIVHPDSYRQGSFTLRKAREFRTHTKCTGEGMKLKCDNKTLEIESSHYGYIQSSKCTTNATSSCQTVDVTSIMKTKCEGKKFCKVKVKESDFGNHCQGVQKGLSVKFDCVKQDSVQQEFKIEATGSGLCVNKDAKLSLCEDKNARTIWKWQGNNLQNTHTGLCLIYKNGNVTVDDCSLKGTKKNKVCLCFCKIRKN
eukprot:gene5032-5691_t